MWQRRIRASEEILDESTADAPLKESVKYAPKLVPVPRELIPNFLNYAANELPWRRGEIQSQDIEVALRAAREHFARTYPNSESFDWTALAKNCYLRIHFAVLDQLDFSCHSLGHLSATRTTSQAELIGFFKSAASLAEERSIHTRPELVPSMQNKEIDNIPSIKTTVSRA